MIRRYFNAKKFNECNEEYRIKLSFFGVYEQVHYKQLGQVVLIFIIKSLKI